MIKVINIVYYCHNDYDHPKQVLAKHAPSLGFVPFIKDRIDIQFVKHLNFEGIEKADDVTYAFFRSINRFWFIPFTTHRYIKKQSPQVIIVEGMIFPLQVIFLKLMLGKRVKIIVQQHNDRPFSGIRRICQRLADQCIDRYIFTSLQDAQEWVDTKIIKSINKCNEVLEASTYFQKKDKTASRQKTGVSGTYSFLWVGRLDPVKNPMVVLRAFQEYLHVNTDARLYMIYQSGSEINRVEKIISENKELKAAVKLVGKIAHDELEYWYSAADFYISGSSREATNYSLLEAMACGCIPIVTDIPSFRKITGEGESGLLYPAGNVAALVQIFKNLHAINREQFSAEVLHYFKTNLSFKNIADDTIRVIEQVMIQ
ncbi:MAG: glycosyltransferase family 4 protein [Bacteroidetes bacterium]|nr:glycosyltransferase family 4 protein [Bacteroidota bacterium]